MKVPTHLIPELKRLVHDLVTGNFALTEADGRAGRLAASDLQHALQKYGRTFVDLPDQAFENREAIPIEGQEGVWAVDVDLWTLEEGRSDLTLSVTVRECGGRVNVEIDDLHAL